jgi:hypothetical protein
MFKGTGVDPLEDDDEDGDTDDDDMNDIDDLDGIEDDDEGDEDESSDDEDIDQIDIEDKVKEGINDLPAQDLEELGDEGAEEERSLSIDEIKELVQKKKNNRKNISYVGVKESALPTENGPMRPQDFDARMAENARKANEPSKTLEDIRRVTEQHRKDEEDENEMKARYENSRRSKYERKRDFHQNNKKHDNKNNKPRNNKQRLDMADLDSIVGDMFK